MLLCHKALLYHLHRYLFLRNTWALYLGHWIWDKRNIFGNRYHLPKKGIVCWWFSISKEDCIFSYLGHCMNFIFGIPFHNNHFLVELHRLASIPCSRVCFSLPHHQNQEILLDNQMFARLLKIFSNMLKIHIHCEIRVPNVYQIIVRA